MQNVLLTIFVFLQLYPLKSVLFLDTTLLASAALVVLYKCYTIGRLQLSFVVLLAVFYTYTLLLNIVSSDVDVYVLYRYLRTLLSAFLLALVISGLGNRTKKIKKIVGALILLHGVTILLQMGFPALKEIMAQLVGHSKDITILRAFGLVGSYDMASIYLCIGMVIYISLYIEQRKNKYLVYIFVLWGAGLFTGRTFMVIGTFLLLLIIIRLLKKANFFTKIGVGLFGLGTIIVFWFAIGPFLMLSLGLQEKGSEGTTLLGVAISDGGYYLGTIDIMEEQAVRLPDNIVDILFGGLPTPQIDNGYLKIIHTHGLLGLGWLFFSYVLLIHAVWKVRARDRWVIITFFGLFLLYNNKMIMFGSRGITELFLLMTYSAYFVKDKSFAQIKRYINYPQISDICKLK